MHHQVPLSVPRVSHVLSLWLPLTFVVSSQGTVRSTKRGSNAFEAVAENGDEEKAGQEVEQAKCDLYSKSVTDISTLDAMTTADEQPFFLGRLQARDDKDRHGKTAVGQAFRLFMLLFVPSINTRLPTMLCH
eukprot:scaffold6173_cov46-Prasinocladus_malaysianus.AAC.3